MKRILVTLGLIFCLLAPSATVIAFGKKDVIKHTLASIVRVEFPLEGRENGICTGFMVAPKHAITAAHCAPEDAGFTVDGEDSFVVKRDGQFALVYAGDKPALKLARQVSLQENVTAFGFAWGDMFVMRGYVAAFKGLDFAVDRPLAPGMSGGPTVNQAGDVVGLNQGTNAVIGILCGAGEIREFLTPSQK